MYVLDIFFFFKSRAVDSSSACRHFSFATWTLLVCIYKYIYIVCMPGSPQCLTLLISSSKFHQYQYISSLQGPTCVLRENLTRSISPLLKFNLPSCLWVVVIRILGGSISRALEWESAYRANNCLRSAKKMCSFLDSSYR